MNPFRAGRLEVEVLGSRILPAMFLVNTQASLAAAIRTANTNAQPDTILLRNGIRLEQAPLPAFTRDGGHPVVLDGNGSTLRRAAGPEFRVLHNNGAVLTVQRLTVANGVAVRGGGGGIFNESGTLILTRDKILRNRAINDAVGAGVYNAPGARLRIAHCTIADNLSGTFGGGLRNQGHVTLIRDSLFANNHAATDGGGGVCNFFGGQIDLIRDSVIVGNSGVHGGGVCNHGVVSLSGCVVVNNRAQISGGGIENDNIVPLLLNSVVAGNHRGQIFPHPPLVSVGNFISEVAPPL